MRFKDLGQLLHGGNRHYFHVNFTTNVDEKKASVLHLLVKENVQNL